MNQVATVAVDTNRPGAREGRPQRSRRSWLGIFVGGLALWVATVLVTFATQNSNLIPTIILLGSFLVPVTFVTYAFSHADPIITPQRIFGAFVVGGILGVLGASLLEAEFLNTPSAFTYLGVGLIEEAVKLAALWLLARRLPRYAVGLRNGPVRLAAWTPLRHAGVGTGRRAPDPAAGLHLGQPGARAGFGFLAAFPGNRRLVARGRGHAVPPTQLIESGGGSIAIA